jgi:hypothetical protein
VSARAQAAVLVLAGTFGLSYCAVLAALILTIVRILGAHARAARKVAIR